MMDTAFEGQRLPVGFTLNIVEIIKNIKIDPMPRTAGVPWGLSLAMGIIFTVLSLSTHISIPRATTTPTGSPFSIEARVLKAGEVPVDILRAAQTPIVSSGQEDSDGGASKPRDLQKALLLAPAAEDGGKWVQKTDMPTPRWGMAVSAVNDKIYAIGGQKTGWVGRWAAVEEYDPSTDTWAKKSDMPLAKQGFTTSVVDEKIYVFAGTDLSTYEYDPIADEWTQKASLPPPPRRWGLSSAVVDGKIYVIGGWDGNNGVFSTVHEYDPATDKWVQKVDMLTERFNLATHTINDRIYAIGGEGVIVGDLKSAVEVYDPLTDSWVEKGVMPEPRVGLRGSVINGKIYLIGGAKVFPVPVAIVEEYTPEDLSVSPQDKLPTTWGSAKSGK